MSDRMATERPAEGAVVDAVVPFHVPALDARGRAVLLGDEIDAMLAAHDYPEPVARLLAEMAALTVILGTSLKFNGKLIVQTQSDGPVSLLVMDFSTPDAFRGYARFDAAMLQASIDAGETLPEQLLGKGLLALTIDQGPQMQRYQGIVQLDGASLQEVATAYFRQSEQIPTRIRLAVSQLVERGGNGPVRRWRAGGLIAQFLPEAPDRMRQADLPGGDAPQGAEPEKPDDDEAWAEVKALVATVEDDELTDENVGIYRLLYRLFHERGVEVFPVSPVIAHCTCSRERLHAVLSTFSAEEIAESTRDGRIRITCEFCSSDYEFDPQEFAAG